MVLRVFNKQLTSSSNGEGALDSAELLVGHERGVGRETNVDLVGLQVAADVLTAILAFNRLTIHNSRILDLRISTKHTLPPKQ
jgi:hypothetical protein